MKKLTWLFATVAIAGLLVACLGNESEPTNYDIAYTIRMTSIPDSVNVDTVKVIYSVEGNGPTTLIYSGTGIQMVDGVPQVEFLVNAERGDDIEVSWTVISHGIVIAVGDEEYEAGDEEAAPPLNVDTAAISQVIREIRSSSSEISSSSIFNPSSSSAPLPTATTIHFVSLEENLLEGQNAEAKVIVKLEPAGAVMQSLSTIQWSYFDGSNTLSSTGDLFVKPLDLPVGTKNGDTLNVEIQSKTDAILEGTEGIVVQPAEVSYQSNADGKSSLAVVIRDANKATLVWLDPNEVAQENFAIYEGAWEMASPIMRIVLDPGTTEFSQCPTLSRGIFDINGSISSEVTLSSTLICDVGLTPFNVWESPSVSAEDNMYVSNPNTKVFVRYTPRSSMDSMINVSRALQIEIQENDWQLTGLTDFFNVLDATGAPSAELKNSYTATQVDTGIQWTATADWIVNSDFKTPISWFGVEFTSATLPKLEGKDSLILYLESNLGNVTSSLEIKAYDYNMTTTSGTISNNFALKSGHQRLAFYLKSASGGWYCQGSGPCPSEAGVLKQNGELISAWNQLIINLSSSTWESGSFLAIRAIGLK